MSTKGVDAAEFLEKLVGPLTLSRLLVAERQGEDMTQTEFARLLGISKSHLSDIECGRKAISPDRAARFARVLQLSEAEFVRLSLQDLVDRAGLRFKVHTSARQRVSRRSASWSRSIRTLLTRDATTPLSRRESSY